MLRRKIYDELISWKNNHGKKALVILGARQVGKTFIVEKFAKDNYETVYELDFLHHPEYNKIFSEALDSETIMAKISSFLGKIELDKKTLLFLDEVQRCPNAITALKYLAQDGRFDVIASGSLLGIAYNSKDEENNNVSFPVGYINTIYMNSLDFEEFCWANGVSEDAIDYLKKCFEEKKTVDEFYHHKFMELFKQYIVVGGMPDVVNSFIENHDYAEVLHIQKEIMNNYSMDIVKYASALDSAKIRNCFFSIPVQLAKENKKFQYNLIEKKGTSEKYFGALEWLKDAGIVSFCYNLKSPSAPLEGNKSLDAFKVYMNDTGLLVSMLDDGTQAEILNGNLGIYKGAIYENVIADILHKSGKNLYYFDYNSTLEIDFFIRFNGHITAVEVKSADNTKSKSLNSVINNWGVEQGIKLSSKNLGINSTNNVLSLPIYMAMLL